MRLLPLLLAISIGVNAQSDWKKVTLPGAPDLYLENGRKPGTTGYDVWQTTVVPRGWLLLFPGMGLSDREGETAVARQMVGHGIVTVVPRINNRLFIDDDVRQSLAGILRSLQKEEGLSDSLSVFVGGFSSGGHLALLLAESRLENRERVDAVFAIDPPTDLAAFYQMGIRRTEMKNCRLLVQEGRQMTQSLEKGLGGTPETAGPAYRRHSAFSLPDGGRANFLRTTPLRLYAEPDTAFWQNKFCESITYPDLNAAPAARFIRFLQDAGNNRAVFIRTENKGYVRGRRFPHAWSIADPAELADWLGRFVRK